MEVAPRCKCILDNCMSQHQHDAATTVKPWMKNKEQIHFCYLTIWRILKAAPGQKHTNGDAAATGLGPC